MPKRDLHRLQRGAVATIKPPPWFHSFQTRRRYESTDIKLVRPRPLYVPRFDDSASGTTVFVVFPGRLPTSKHARRWRNRKPRSESAPTLKEALLRRTKRHEIAPSSISLAETAMGMRTAVRGILAA